ncbi:MAG TPA: hypothetical protein VM141_12395 [Planctomycetota bacterium]|nr:hypothetical protein [Planctomycetota bacterium]
MIQRKAARAFLLEYAGRARPFQKLSRVSETAFETLENRLREACRALVDGQPRTGKTIKG